MEWAMNRILDTPEDGGTQAQPPPIRAPAQPEPQSVAALPPPPSYGDRQAQDDQDADLQRAVAASMVEQPPQPSGGAPPGYSDDDEELMRALAASVESQGNGGVSVRADLLRLRSEHEPVVFVPSIPTYKAIALALQSLYAALPARLAFLTYSLADTRTNLTNYWSGASPACDEREDVARFDTFPASAREDIRRMQRWQTLFAFSTYTRRAAVVTGDTDALLPNDVRLQASWQQGMQGLLGTFLDVVVRAWNVSSETEAETIVLDARSATDAARDEFLCGRRRLFQTYAVPADAGQPANAQPTAYILLDHSQTETSVPACLARKLVEDAEVGPLLITQAPHVLLLPIQHTSSSHPFRIDLTIHMDAFMWDKRSGHTDEHDQEYAMLLADHKAKESEKMELMTRLGQLTEGDTPSLVSESQTYLEHVAESSLSDWMAQVRDALNKRVHGVNVHLTTLRTRMAQMQEVRAADPAWQSTPYDLCAAVFQSRDSEWSYVVSEGQWWRIEDACARAVDADAIAVDTATPEAHVVMLTYAQRMTLPDATPQILARLRDAITRDNHDAEHACLRE